MRCAISQVTITTKYVNIVENSYKFIKSIQ